MADIEKTINELSSWLNATDGIETEIELLQNPPPFFAIANALKLLKEQQPKLMTLKEVEQSNGKDVFVEVHYTPNGNCDFPKYDAIYASTIEEDQPTFDFVWFYMHIKHKKDYGVSWRCWTARPTEEQRKAEPWKDGGQE